MHGRYRIERQFKLGGHFAPLKVLDRGVGLVEAQMAFARAVKTCSFCRVVRLLGPDGKEIERAELVKAGAGAGQAVAG